MEKHGLFSDVRFVIATIIAVLALGSSPAYAYHVEISAVIIDGASPDISRDLTFTRQIFDQIDLGVTLVSLQHSSTLPTDINDTNAGAFLRDPTWQRGPTLTVWYAPTTHLSGNLVPGWIDREEVKEGCFLGICIVDEFRYGIFVSDDAANDTLARLIGFALTDLEYGPDDPSNLLGPLASHQSPGRLADVYPRGLGLDRITDAQFELMKTSSFYTPEPSTVWLLAIASLLFLPTRRRCRAVAAPTS